MTCEARHPSSAERKPVDIRLGSAARRQHCVVDPQHGPLGHLPPRRVRRNHATRSVEASTSRGCNHQGRLRLKAPRGTPSNSDGRPPPVDLRDENPSNGVGRSLITTRSPAPSRWTRTFPTLSCSRRARRRPPTRITPPPFLRSPARPRRGTDNAVVSTGSVCRHHPSLRT